MEVSGTWRSFPPGPGAIFISDMLQLLSASAGFSLNHNPSHWPQALSQRLEAYAPLVTITKNSRSSRGRPERQPRIEGCNPLPPLQPPRPPACGMWGRDDVTSTLLNMCPMCSAELAPSTSALLDSARSPPPSPRSHVGDAGAITAISIQGMMCGHCTGKVQKALLAVPGVTGVVVDLEGSCATVTGDAPAGVLVAAVELVGFVGTVAGGAETAVRTTSLAVQGMMCGHCTGKVEAALSAVPGVRTVAVDLGAGRATVTGDAASAALVAAVEAVGFSASEASSGVTTLSVQGMHCAHCTSKVKAALAAVPGAGSISVNLACGTATVMGALPMEAAALVQAVEQAGFQASPLGPAAPQHEAQTSMSHNGMPPAPDTILGSASTGISSFFREEVSESGAAEDREGELTPVLEPSPGAGRSSRSRLLAVGAVPSNGTPRGRRCSAGDRGAAGAGLEVPQEMGASVMLGVSGMTCDSCRVGVERCLSAL
eukprot:scaffold9864_cov124-Isochrysis_galbana.AAC.9